MILNNGKFFEMQSSPSDSISEIAFSDLHNMMIVSSWDGTISIYNPLSANGLLNAVRYTKPMLSCVFSKSNPAHCFGGSADGNLHFADLEKGTLNSIKAHSDGIKSVRAQTNAVITASWDKTIKIWDTRSAQCTKTISCDGKVYCMDLQNNLLAYGTSLNNVYTINTNNFDTAKKMPAKFNYMLKCVSVASDNRTFIVGGIEGKCEVFNTASYYNGIIFKSHRTNTDVYAVNSVNISLINSNVLITAGSNGELIFYDSQSKLKTFTKKEDLPITAGALSRDSKIYAYGIGDDWSKGFDGKYKRTTLKIMDVTSSGIKV